MTFTILNRKHTRLRVKQWSEGLSTDKILGAGIDVMKMPDSHLCCPICSGHLFEASIFLDNRRIEMGCVGCGLAQRVMFPLDLNLEVQGITSGRFTCTRHPTKAMIMIKNQETVCIGCEKCYTEIQIKVKTKTGIILADA